MITRNYPSSPFSSDTPTVELRGVHLDLKGLAPTFDRLLRLLDVFAQMRFNAVLIEWEDTFPWSFDEQLRGETCYTKSQVQQIAQRCETLGIELIPLVQSLGHLENVLKRDCYASMRELPHRTDCLNPLAEGAQQLIQQMISEMLVALPNTRWIHLGGDEAWVWGSHPDTSAYIQEHSSAQLYMHHMNPLMDRMLQQGIRPILWHDMMVDWNDQDLAAIAEKSDLMVWGYRGTPDDRRHHHRRETLDRMATAGVTMWGGSAYKGADGPSRDLPDAEARLVNNLGWADAAHEYGMRGVVATGWSRYAFSRIQVEPIDACLRELAMVGIVLHNGAWPSDGWDRCDALLQTLGESERCVPLRDHIEVLESTRNETWMRIRQLKEHLAGLAVEPQRGDGGMAAFLFEHCEPWVARVEALCEELTPLLAPFVGKPSARAYCDVRAVSLRTEIEQVREVIESLLPQGTAATSATLAAASEI